MSNRLIQRVCGAATIVLAFSIACAAQETRITAKQVPIAVMSAFKSAYPQATIRGYSKEKEHGKVFYEVESKDGDVSRDVLYNPDGTVAEVEESMPMSDLPNEVREAMHAKYPKAVVTSAEKITHDGVTEYEAHAKLGKKRIEVKFDATGKVLEVE